MRPVGMAGSPDYDIQLKHVEPRLRPGFSFTDLAVPLESPGQPPGQQTDHDQP